MLHVYMVQTWNGFEAAVSRLHNLSLGLVGQTHYLSRLSLGMSTAIVTSLNFVVVKSDAINLA